MELDLHTTLLAYERTLRFDPYNVSALCDIGKALHQFNRLQDARKCYKAAVEVLKRTIRAGDADAALNLETMIYLAFVRPVEDEQHYYRCFADWRVDMARLGKQFRKSEDFRGDPNRIAFYLHTGFILGHSEVLFKMLDNIPGELRATLVLRIYVRAKYEQAFVERAQRIGIEVVLIRDCVPGGESATTLEKFQYLRERLRRDGIGVCIWVTSPETAAFALSMRLAPVQIFWALRFHPVTGPYIDGYITYGSRDETERVYGKRKWRVCPPLLTIDATPPDPAAVAGIRAKFPEPLLLGTIAREDKINSKPYLECVAQILQMHLHVGFLWTGKDEHAGITSFLRNAGVAERCHFVGWVDVNLYANAMDVFLETFPLGGGVSGYCALAGGVPLVSYLTPYTVLGNHLWHNRSAKNPPPDSGDAVPDTSPLSSDYILCAHNTDEYVAFATRLVTDNAFRQVVGQAGQAFYECEASSAQEYTRRFFDTVQDIAQAKNTAIRSA